jgi:predicted dehydrogenase
MIRLAISGIDAAVLPAIFARLRGAVISPLDGCEAVAFLESSSETTAVRNPEQFLHAQRHVLLSARDCCMWAELDRLKRAARLGGCRLAVANEHRYLPSRQLIKAQLDAGKLGAVGLVRIHHWESISTVDGAASPTMYESLLPDIDLAQWLIGTQPQVIYTTFDSSGSLGQVHLGFSAGAMALIDYTELLPPGNAYQSLAVIGSVGASYSDDHNNGQLLYQGGLPRAVRTEERLQQLAAMVQDFIDAVAVGRELSSGVAWESTLEVADAVRLSFETRRAVSLEDL